MDKVGGRILNIRGAFDPAPRKIRDNRDAASKNRSSIGSEAGPGLVEALTVVL